MMIWAWETVARNRAKNTDNNGLSAMLKEGDKSHTKETEEEEGEEEQNREVSLSNHPYIPYFSLVRAWIGS